MPKAKTPLRYVVKIHSARLRKAKWNLSVSIDELRRKAEIVSLGNSQLLEWMDELNGVTDNDAKGLAIKERIKVLGQEKSSVANRKSLKRLREELFELMFKEDYLLVIMDNVKDFRKLCTESFVFNGKHMKFLIATVGGVKTSTMIFVTDRLYDELWRRLNNGRNPDKMMIPAKLEAYMALACSGSVRVSDPEHVLVVNDCITHFKDNIIRVRDADDGSLEPTLTFEDDVECEYNESDGYGLISPELCRKWGYEIGEGGYVSGMNCRCAFTKGMLFTFPFQRFAHEVAHKTVVKDVWGDEHDIDTVDLILTTSQLKLWDSYKSWNDYWTNCKQNGYCFRISKVCPRRLETERTTNYQFIQPYDLTDDQVNAFIEPTLQSIRDMKGGDWARTILYVNGTALSERDAEWQADWKTALMTNPNMMHNPFVRSKVNAMIKRRIEDAAIGVIDVHGNYCIISGDPYSLCQSIFGLEVTGLLKAGECYHRYWADHNAPEVVVFRAPMSCANNIRKLKVADSDLMRDWYSYMRTCLILNSWDNTCSSLNGADKDSDSVLITDNKYLLDYAPLERPIVCDQKSAAKKAVEHADFIDANIAAAGDDIGAVTNRCTSMYDKITMVDDPEQIKTLRYRIRASQHEQQNCIDKAKGVETRPYPPNWYDMRSLKIEPTDEPEVVAQKEFDRTIAVNRKPYFMKYVYDDVRRDYNEFIVKANQNALCRFGTSLARLEALVESGEATAKQKEYVDNYYHYMPVSIGNCVVNRICRRVESEFMREYNTREHFDYRLFKADVPTNKNTCGLLLRLFHQYEGDNRQLMTDANKEGLASDAINNRREVLLDYYRELCYDICSNEVELCESLVKVCCYSNASEQFVWDMCGEQIIKNLLKNTDGKLHYPVRDRNGDIAFKGERFKMIETDMTEEKA